MWEFTPISSAVTGDQNHTHLFHVFMFYKNIKLTCFYTYILFQTPKYTTANGVHALKREFSSLIEYHNTSDVNPSYGLNVTAMIAL